MNFENLRTSLELNRKAEPTVELAFRLAHLLFRDIAEEAGVPDIVDCPAGKPAKFLKVLIRQCYITETICSGNAGMIEGYRDEVEAYLAEIRKMKEECETLESQMTPEEPEETIRTLEMRLETARKNKAEYDARQETRTRLENEIADLQNYDPSQIQAEIEALEKERDRLLGDNAQLESEKEKLSLEINEQNEKKRQMNTDISDLMRESEDNRTAIARKKDDKEKWRGDRDLLANELSEADEELERYVNAYTEEKEKYDKLVNETIPAQKQLVENLEKSTGEKEAELKTLEGKLETLTETEAGQQSEIEERQKKENELKEKLEQMKNGILSLDENIGKLQNEVEDLESKNDAQRLEQLKADLDDKRKKLIKAGEDCAVLVAEIALEEAAIKTKESEYTILNNRYEEQKRSGETLKERRERICDEMKNLTFILGTDEEILKELERTGNELNFLNKRRRMLCESIEKMAKYLDADVNLEEAPEHAMYPYYQKLQMTWNLEEIGSRLESLRKCIAETAAFLKKL